MAKLEKMMLESKLADAITRVQKYLDELARIPRGIEKEEIHGLHRGDEREAILNASDLRTIIAAHTDSGWISVEDRLPETDEDGIARVWAIEIGFPTFPRSPSAGVTRYHKTLGWQPENSTGWDWIITHWRHFPPMPATASR